MRTSAMACVALVGQVPEAERTRARAVSKAENCSARIARLDPAVALAGLIAMAAACRQDTPQPHAALDGSADVIRDDFNAARGNVRVVLLVAPG